MAESETILSEKVTITLPNPRALVLRTKKIVVALFYDIYNPLSNSASSIGNGASARARRMRFPKMRRFNFSFKRKYLKILFPAILAIIVIALIASLIKALPDASSKPANTINQVSIPNAMSTLTLNRKMNFPLKDNSGVVVGDFDYVLQSAEIQKQIIVQGQKATAIPGRVFLIINLKLTNNLKKSIQLNTRDYIRVIVASDPTEQLAPDIHNDPVEVQAISTKFTRLGLAIDEKDAHKTIHLKVGEITGTKQNIDLNFKY